MKNNNLHKAKTTKNDEFYTMLADIEKELMHYKEHLKDKIIFCNCDDPEYSNFWKYFKLNFECLGLKKLISTHYTKEQPSYKLEMFFENDELKTVKTPLVGGGDFASPECTALLDECDICITNPPFSLFRSFINILVEHNKKFLILGNINAITYKEVFPLIKDNKIWFGYKFNKTTEFIMPDSYELKGKGFVDDQGKKHGFVPGITWYTNLDISKRHYPFNFHKSYSSEEFPKYNNYDAINVNKVSDIPEDYKGVMGVPITFLDRYCPEQFEIIGATESEGKGFSNGLWKPETKVSQPVVKGNRIYKRILIKRKENA